jgi:hypothetical protein
LSLVVACAALVGCGQQKDSGKTTTPETSIMTWTNMLETYRPTILTGGWMQAESFLGKLGTRRTWTDEELKDWIQLQVDVLEKTRNDPLKSALRMSAIQEMYYFPEETRSRLTWLKEGLATNLFLEPAVAKKARELVADLEARRP